MLKNGTNYLPRSTVNMPSRYIWLTDEPQDTDVITDFHSYLGGCFVSGMKAHLCAAQVHIGETCVHTVHPRWAFIFAQAHSVSSVLLMQSWHH